MERLDQSRLRAIFEDADKSISRLTRYSSESEDSKGGCLYDVPRMLTNRSGESSYMVRDVENSYMKCLAIPEVHLFSVREKDYSEYASRGFHAKVPRAKLIR